MSAAAAGGQYPVIQYSTNYVSSRQESQESTGSHLPSRIAVGVAHHSADWHAFPHGTPDSQWPEEGEFADR